MIYEKTSIFYIKYGLKYEYSEKHGDFPKIYEKDLYFIFKLNLLFV
jgi:hypothetical protein